MAHAFIFDLDGTLIDSRDDLTAAVNFIRSRFGLARLSSSEVVKHAGLDFRHLVENTVIKSLPDADLEATLGGFRVYYRRNMTERTKPYPQVAETLKELAGTGVKLAVASNKPVKLAKEVLAALGLLDYFLVVMGPDEIGNGTGGRAKLFSAIASALKVRPSKCVVVGDTVEDIEAAKAAKMAACGVIWGFGEEKDLLSAGAEQVLSSPGDLLSLVDPKITKSKKAKSSSKVKAKAKSKSKRSPERRASTKKSSSRSIPKSKHVTRSSAGSRR